jgi:uncharacterized protein YaiI (UPF0178 family)
MQIWVDADACPLVIKQTLFRAAERWQIHTHLVANHFMTVPASKWIQFHQVGSGYDVADHWIVNRVEPGDLVVTADIPLAWEVVQKQAVGLNPRGERYTESNIKSRLVMRDFMESLRTSGIQTGGPASLSLADRQRFANQLDQILAKNAKVPHKVN